MTAAGFDPMALSPQVLSPVLSPYLQAPRWLIAYSGGVDSHVLLQLLAEMPERPPLLAVHVNHQLQPQADGWAQHCQQQVKTLGLELVCERVMVDLEGGKSPEEAAREARYQVFEHLLQARDVLMMAHHLDDQAETLLLRLLRGSGSQGLAAMPVSRPLGQGLLLRPLLAYTRRQIETFARERGLSWVDDPSNQNAVYDRNFLRREVLPLIEQRWPRYRSTLARAAALSDESFALNRELAALDCHALSLSPLAPSLSIAALKELSPGRQKNLLRYWLHSRALALPSTAQMAALLTEVVGARPDAEPLLAWPGVQVRRFRDELYAMLPLAAFNDPGAVPLFAGKAVDISGVGRVGLESTRSGGMRADCLAGTTLEIRFRRGSERCRPRGRANSQTLKKLLQEYGIEPWLRDRVPLLYVDGELAAVGDYWVCAPFATDGEEGGYCLRWHRQFTIE